MINSNQVVRFKQVYCNENSIIIDLIKNSLTDHFIEPILDIGGGMGDIALNALYDKKVTCLDVNDFSNEPISPNHKRIQTDFFTFQSDIRYNTVTFIHSLQFLDSDIKSLNRKVEQLAPQVIITVTNCNNDFLGQLIDFLETNGIQHNAEKNISEFPPNYDLITIKKFRAELICSEFDELIQQLLYLLDISYDYNSLISIFVKENLLLPKISINQDIRIYSYGKK